LFEINQNKFTDLIAEKTKENPAFIHLDMLGLLKIAKNNEERFTGFCNLLTEIENKGGNICIPAYSLSYTKGEDFNLTETPSENVGAVSEFVRKKFPERRTVDALFSYLVFGKNISGKHFNITDYESFGKDSIIEEVFEKDGYLWSIGGVFKNSTEIHYIEKLLQLDYRSDKIFSGKIIDKTGKLHLQNIKYYCKNFDFNLVYDFKNLETDLRNDGLFETIKADDYPLFVSGIKFKTLYEYVELKIKKDKKYFLKNLRDKRD